MGMYDRVRYEMDCPGCGAKLSDFQSQDRASVMDTLDFWEVRNFYTLCKCGTWVEFTRRGAVDINDYDMNVSRKV